MAVARRASARSTASRIAFSRSLYDSLNAIARVMSVSMKPGATTFTVMLREPISRASDFEKPIIPAFAAE